MKKNHLWLMILCCLGPIILVFVFLSFFKGNSNYLIWLIILLCPLSHFLMMRGHKNNHSCEKDMHKKDKILYKCPECGLEYEEKNWAEKCEDWCKKNKSCNLEITKHAVKKQ